MNEILKKPMVHQKRNKSEYGWWTKS